VGFCVEIQYAFFVIFLPYSVFAKRNALQLFVEAQKQERILLEKEKKENETHTGGFRHQKRHTLTQSL